MNAGRGLLGIRIVAQVTKEQLLWPKDGYTNGLSNIGRGQSWWIVWENWQISYRLIPERLIGAVICVIWWVPQIGK